MNMKQDQAMTAGKSSVGPVPPAGNTRMTRRDVLRVLGAAGGAVLTGCHPTGSADFSVPAQPPTSTPIPTRTSAPTSTTASATQLASITQPDCVVRPRQTEGPFYFDVGLVRRNITENKPGIPLLVAIHLVQAGSCHPIRDAVVDIWHADAVGQYSGYKGQGDDDTDTTGETFLRGIQVTNANGLAEFETIYPGSYRGRTVHIHFKAYTREQRFITSQLYFPDDTTDAVHLAEPYSTRGPRGTTNADDRIFSRDLVGRVTPYADGYLASLVVGIVM